MTHFAFIAFGSNLWLDENTPPKRVLERAIVRLCSDSRLTLLKCSSFYQTMPDPPSDQPWYTNGLLKVATDLNPQDLLALLLDTERDFGRKRGEKNAARTLDFDLIAYDALCLEEPKLVLPHPRMHLRAFVLQPFYEIEPTWQHPKLKCSLSALLKRLNNNTNDGSVLIDSPVL